jgi:hypothetical protein
VLNIVGKKIEKTPQKIFKKKTIPAANLPPVAN